MGRAGITLLDVEKAALQLQGRGKNPSVDAVREVLGTGSKSTIAQHLRDWKAKQTETQGRLPEELIALITGLWERLNLGADQRITEIETSNKQQMDELKQTLNILHQDYAQSQKQLHQSQETYEIERIAKEKIEKALLFSQQEHDKLIERHQVTVQQLDDCKNENSSLHQLANNIQANLEHYQNAIQQLRTEQNLVIEKQQTQFQQEIARLQHELSSRHLQLQEYEKQINQKTLEGQHFQNQYVGLQETHQALIKHNQEIDHELILVKDRYKQQEKILSTQEQNLVIKNKQTLELEKQIAILTEQKIHLQKSFDQVEDKIESLRQEKIFLIQEKFELQGHLKQLEQATNV